jgi:3-oxoacyl-[acyl-carrier protein] reductase
MENQPVALVTGGSGGLGRGISLALAREGFTVLINFNHGIAAAEQTRGMIEEAGGRAELCQADLVLVEHRDLLLDFCMETLGRLDVLVNNASANPPGDADLLEISEKSYDRALDVNLKAPFFLTRAAAELMLRQIKDRAIPGATIINVSSANAYAASLDRGAYCISKAGASMMTTLFAWRLAGSGIRVHEVRAGLIETEVPAAKQKRCTQRIKEGLSPLQRWGRPEDVGRAVAMLTRDDLPFSTGEVVNVDGGFHLRRQ